jgi:uncharacterized membrane protein
MAGGDGQEEEKGLGRELADLVASGFGVGVVAVFAAFVLAIVYQVGAWGYEAWSSPGGIPWSTILAVGTFFVVIAQVVWVMAKDVLSAASESVDPVARRARRAADEARERREQEREREALQDEQGGALSMSAGGEGGELSEVVFSEGGLEVSDEEELMEEHVEA